MSPEGTAVAQGITSGVQPGSVGSSMRNAGSAHSA